MTDEMEEVETAATITWEVRELTAAEVTLTWEVEE